MILGVAAARADEAAPIYQPGAVSVIRLGLSPEAEAELEAEPDEYVAGTFSLAITDGIPGGEETSLTPTPLPAEIRLKGSSSFEPLSSKAAFKIKFKKKERFLGLRKMTLNNMVQDPSMVHETLAYAAFRAAGVPAPRTGFAYVFVNGEDFGVELNLETVDGDFLEKHFGPFDEETQHLYEGEDGHDVTPGSADEFEVDEGDEEDIADLEALIAAVNSEGSAPWSKRVAPYADLGEMTKMWAVEKYVGQWDGYSGQVGAFQPNNYYLYSSPSGEFQMLPWGTDETFQSDEQIPFDGPAGLLFDRCLEDAACATAYWHSLAGARDSLQALDLDSLATRTAALLAPWQQMEHGNERHKYSLGEIEDAVGETRAYVLSRPAEAAEWLAAHVPPTPPSPPAPPLSPTPTAPLAAPTIATIRPASGSVRGGTSVTITGTDLEGAVAVEFGSAQASRYRVDSATQITAAAPPSRTVHPVPLTVTTAAGTAHSSRFFNYVGCVVPGLKGRSLGAAKRKLRAGRCRAGAVSERKGATAKAGRIVGQSPGAGRVLAPGAKVKLTLAPAPR